MVLNYYFAIIINLFQSCFRALSPDYVQETKYNGLNVFEYSAILLKPEEKCFCLNPKKCLKPGALDLTNCSGKIFFFFK